MVFKKWIVTEPSDAFNPLNMKGYCSPFLEDSDLPLPECHASEDRLQYDMSM